MTALLAIAYLLALIQTPGDALSARGVVEKMLDARSQIHTAKVELEIVDAAGTWQGRASDKPQFITEMIAGERSVLIRRGDAEGVVVRRPDGQPDPKMGHMPYYILEEPGRAFERSDDPLSTVRGRTRPPRSRNDLRALGVAAFPSRFELHDAVWFDNVHNPAAPRLERSRDGELEIVRLTMSTKQRTYWIDPARDWSVVRVREEDEQGGWRESRSDLVQTDGVWFPRSVLFFSSRFKDGREPSQIVRVTDAEFNRPSHPPRLTLTHIGVEVGMTVDTEDSGGRTVGRWDGDNVVSSVEFVQRLVSGELAEGPSLVAANAAAYDAHVRATLDAGADAPVDLEPLAAMWVGPIARRWNETKDPKAPRRAWTPWEAYVRDFIQRYQLDDEQRQKAQLILNECEERAEIYLDSRKGEMLKLLEAGVPIGARGPNDDPRDKGPRERLDQLLAPLARIFERQLKPRLERLPTRAQRSAAGEK